MKKKIKDLTFEDMINICKSHRHETCLNCQIFHVCGYTPYEVTVREDVDKEIDL